MNIDIIGVPIFYGCDKVGVEKGPDILRENGLINIFKKNHNTIDIGNIAVNYINPIYKYESNNKLKYLNSVISTNKKLAYEVNRSLNNNRLPIVIGGDHSLALGSIAGCSKYYKSDIGVIWVDAHGDINTEETSPTGNIHGMPLAASMGVGHNRLKNLYFNDIKVKSENVFILSCRDLDPGEIELINKLNINTYNINEIKRDGVDNILVNILNIIKNKNIKNIHFSYDIDCLDPIYVPGTGTPVKNGLMFDESEKIIKTILNTGLVRSVDFVEFNPDLDIDNITLNTCIKLLNIFSNELK